MCVSMRTFRTQQILCELQTSTGQGICYSQHNFVYTTHVALPTAVHPAVRGGRSSEEVHEELLDPLCVKTTALDWCVGGDLHAKRTAIGEVVVVEESRS